MTARYPRNRIASVLFRSGFPDGYRIMPVRHAAKPLATVPADSRFCSRDGGYQVAPERRRSRSRCRFAAHVIEVRRKYGLTVARRKAHALDAVLAACPPG